MAIDSALELDDSMFWKTKRYLRPSSQNLAKDDFAR